MRTVRLVILLLVFILAVIVGAFVSAVVSSAQVINPDLRPDLRRALRSPQPLLSSRSRSNGSSAISVNQRPKRSGVTAANVFAARLATNSQNIPATVPIPPGTSLNRVLHTSQLSFTSTAGTDEQFVDRNLDLAADERTTFDSAGGSFDIAVGRSGSRYEVYSATLQNRLIGVLVVALDTNGDFVVNQSATYDLQRDFGLPSAAAVVAGTALDGREFIVVSSSGYYNSENPGDPHNEPSPGIVILVRNPLTGGFDNSRSRTLVSVGDNRLFNANGLALLPNNDVLIADFASYELRIIRDTNQDGYPDTLDDLPYYSYRFSDDAPLDVTANSRGVVFSHSVGNDSLMLAVYDDNGDGRADRDEVVVEGLSIDNNLFLHGLTVDQKGNVYVIEDASSSFDGSEGNGGIARIDAFPDPNQDGTLRDGAVFSTSDFDDDALSGLAFGPSAQRRKMTRKSVRTTGGADESDNPSVVDVPVIDPSSANEILILNLPWLVDSDSDKEKQPCVVSAIKEGEAKTKSEKKKSDKPQCSNE